MMAQKFQHLSDKHKDFIIQQQLFFVGTADVDGCVNISPKGLDSLRIINNNKVMWLNLTGSGNETAAHIRNESRMTLMFLALEGRPLILRLYGQATVVHQYNQEWDDLFLHFDSFTGARQIFIMEIDCVQTSCGMAVPLFDFQKQRDELIDSFDRRGEQGIQDYWTKKNQLSIDGKETMILSNHED